MYLIYSAYKTCWKAKTLNYNECRIMTEDASPLFCIYCYGKISLLLREFLIVRSIQEGIPRITCDRPLLSEQQYTEWITNDFPQAVEYFSCVTPTYTCVGVICVSNSGEYYNKVSEVWRSSVCMYVTKWTVSRHATYMYRLISINIRFWEGRRRQKNKRN
jgi:hypothetical protein